MYQDISRDIYMYNTVILSMDSNSKPRFVMCFVHHSFPQLIKSIFFYIMLIWLQVAEYCPHQCLDWLASQVSRNKYAHNWTLKNMNVWVEPFLLSNNNVRVRNCEYYPVTCGFIWHCLYALRGGYTPFRGSLFLSCKSKHMSVTLLLVH